MTCSRREFFTQFGPALAADVAESMYAVRRAVTSRLTERQAGVRRRRNAWLRPPGALPEKRFLDVCTRCTDCREACPYDAIRRLGPEFAERSQTPAIIPLDAPCYLCEDMPCIAACKPKALMPVERCAVDMGVAIIDAGACYVAKGQPCDYCVVRCPIGRDAILLDDDNLPSVREDGCTGCGVCAYLCPGSAIFITPARQE